MSDRSDKSFLSALAENPVEELKGMFGLGGEQPPRFLEPQSSKDNPYYPDALRDAERGSGKGTQGHAGSDGEDRGI